MCRYPGEGNRKGRDVPHDARRPGVEPSGGDLCDGRFVLAVGVEDDLSQSVLRAGVDDRPQQREAATLAVHRVLPGWKRHIAPARLALPDREADQLEAVEVAAGEVQLGVGGLSGRPQDGGEAEVALPDGMPYLSPPLPVLPARVTISGEREIWRTAGAAGAGSLCRTPPDQAARDRADR